MPGKAALDVKTATDLQRRQVPGSCSFPVKKDESIEDSKSCTQWGKNIRKIQSGGVEPPKKRVSLAKKPKDVVPSGCRKVCERLVDNKYVSFLMMTITLYVLCSEDVRLLSTDKPTDIYFGIVGIICLVLFSAEIVLSCIGKDDYFMGFFFVLDVISTSTLILDLPWVSDAMAESQDEDMGQASKGRTARIGAKAARMVRVLRLIRVVKLYKAVQENRERQAKAKRAAENGQTESAVQPGDELGQEKVQNQHENTEETRVGKRLSEMTTRRVILLVLAMLLGVPVFSVDESVLLATSPTYGTDEVWITFQDLLKSNCSLPTAGVSPSETCERVRWQYEQAMLRFMYYHNWFTGRVGCPGGTDGGCSKNVFSHFFMVGLSGSEFEEASAKESLLKAAQLRSSTVDKWQADLQGENDRYNYGPMPDSVLKLIGGEWDATCDMSSYKMYGISLLKDELTFKDYEVSYAVQCPRDLRPVERTRFTPSRMTVEEFQRMHLSLWFDKRPFVQEQAAQSLLMTLFVCVCLLTAAMMFHNDVSQLVLYPVETMISRVQTIRDNPMNALIMAEEEYRKELAKEGHAEAQSGANNQGGQFDGTARPSWKQRISTSCKKLVKILACTSRSAAEPMETLILERTIIKLGSLLVLGFGEAGANIVTQNMKGQASASVCAMVAGVRVDCVIGSVRIQDFSTVTEVLQTEVMNFVNQVAEIVHGVVDEFHGAPNKNNGDTFLVIWRTAEMESESASKMADLAVTAFARIIGAVHQSPILANYRGHPGLQWRICSDYRVTLNSGLHCGWAIEGAVGSEFKIDASYLSPNVSVAVNVEDYTQVYGVHLLATEMVVKRCTQPMRGVCRLIDNVFISGSKDSLKLYSVDLCWHELEVDEPLMMGWNTRMRFRARQWLEMEKQRKWKANSMDLFDGNSCIGPMREKYTEEFFQLFSMGFQNYQQGEWRVAMTFLKHTRTMLGFLDGPSCAIMDFMEHPYDFEAPEDWNGVRALDEAAKLRSEKQEHQRELLEDELLARRMDGVRSVNTGEGALDMGKTSSMTAGSAEWDASSSLPKLRRKGTGSSKRKGPRGASRKTQALPVAATPAQSEDQGADEYGIMSEDATGEQTLVSPMGDGTGGTGSRRSSPMIAEASVIDLCSQLNQSSADSQAGAQDAGMARTSRRVMIKTGAGTGLQDADESMVTKGSALMEDGDSLNPPERKIKSGLKDPTKTKGKLKPHTVYETEASTGATCEASDSAQAAAPAPASRSSVKVKKNDKMAAERRKGDASGEAKGRQVRGTLDSRV